MHILRKTVDIAYISLSYRCLILYLKQNVCLWYKNYLYYIIKMMTTNESSHDETNKMNLSLRLRVFISITAFCN